MDTTIEFTTPQTALTAKEAAILRAWPTNYGSAEAEKGDNATWSDIADLAKATGMSLKTARAVVGSLVKKGLVEGGHERANGEPGELQVLTEVGIDAVFALRAEGAEKATVQDQPNTLLPACDPNELLAAYAEERGVKVEIVDHMTIVRGFGTGAHSRLKNFSLGHFRRFPQWTPQTGRYVAVTEKFGLVEFLEGKILREELVGKQVPVVALARVVEG